MNGTSPATVPCVLIADDDFSTRLLLGEAAQGAGFRTVSACDGQEALAVFAAELPDVVVLDVRMPNGNGYEVCRALRQLPTGTDVPVLMVTGLDDLVSIEAAYDAGATDFITKPVHYLLLPYRLRYLLRAATAFRDARQGALRLSRVQRLARLGQWELDVCSGTFEWSPEARFVFGLPEDETATISALCRWVHRDDRPRVEALMKSGHAHRIDYRMVLPDGTERLIHQEAEQLGDPNCPSCRLVGAVQDITQQRVAERQVTRLAYFDTLTGLPNRTYLVEFLERAVSAASRSNETVGVLALDLDLFKRVNDTYGHSVGDNLLEQVATRLTESIRGSDDFGSMPPNSGMLVQSGTSVAARFGGDEFLVVLSHIRTAQDAGVVAQRILDRLATTYYIDGVELQVCASIGIATYPETGLTVETLLQRADAAMYHAKDLGRNNFQFFCKDIHDKAQRRMTVETALRSTLTALTEHPDSAAASSMALHFQPKVCSLTGDVKGVEALLRWTTADGPISPTEFIPVAEDTGIIVALGEWVLRQACRTAAHLGGIRVAVNVSARQFRDPAFLNIVRSALADTLCNPDLIEIEITEGVVMQDTDQSMETFAALKAMGLRLSLDDFGTGYSSLSYLTRFPIDQLKIDRSFVRDIWQLNNATIVSAIIALARNLSLDIVVEGVETQAHARFLESFGALELQGYYFAYPMPEAKLVAWLRERRATQTTYCSQMSPSERSNEERALPGQ